MVMLKWWKSLTVRQPAARKPPRRRLAVETLEQRALLSGGPGAVELAQGLTADDIMAINQQLSQLPATAAADVQLPHGLTLDELAALDRQNGYPLPPVVTSGCQTTFGPQQPPMPVVPSLGGPGSGKPTTVALGSQGGPSTPVIASAPPSTGGTPNSSGGQHA